MKKKILLVLCLALSIMMAGCNNEDNKEETGNDINESAAKIDKEITSGQFVIEGVTYEFPMNLQYWLDNGWHISDNYENRDEFELDPWYTSTQFEIYNEEGDYVRMYAFNNSDQAARLEDCMVYYLYVPLSSMDNIVLPGGINMKSTLSEVKASYGEPLSEVNQSDIIDVTYHYANEDAWKCYVELSMLENETSSNPLTSVSYRIETIGDIWDSLIDSEGADKACEMFINATMKTIYWGEHDDYLTYAIDTKSRAEALYESEVTYFKDCLMYYTDIDTSYVTADMSDRIDKIAREVLSKLQWNIKEIELDAFEEGTVFMELYPTNFFRIIENDITNAINNFNTTYDGVDFEAMTDEEYTKVEEEYIKLVVEAMEAKLSEAGTLEAVVKEYELDAREDIISSDAWQEIDDILMDIQQ